MKFTVFISRAKTRLIKRKALQAPPDVDDVPKTKSSKPLEELSPQDLEKHFLAEMAEACNALPMKKMVYLDAIASHLHTIEDPSGKILANSNAPRVVQSLVTGTTACLAPSAALTGTTLVNAASRHSSNSNASFQRPAAPVSTPSRTLKVADFQPIKFLGAGGFGLVFLVFDRVTHKYFALKVIEKKRMHFSFFPTMFEEQRIGKALAGSKWAVGVEGSFDDSDNFYILMNYSAGGDLHYRIHKHGTLDHDAIRDGFAELIVALEDLHNRRIMHRDLKPANILVDEDGHLLLADFGLSKAFGVPTDERPWDQMPAWAAHPTDEKLVTSDDDGRDLAVERAGTPGYTAPEVTAGEPYSYESDVFSLGVVIYVLLFDASPFGIDNKMSATVVTDRISTVPVTFPVHAGPRTRDLLSRMLEKDPRRRITLSQIKSHAFFRSYDWELVAQRGSSGSMKAELFRGVAPHLITKQRGIRIPAGTAFQPGQSPFPWFEYAAPALTEAAHPDITLADAKAVDIDSDDDSSSSFFTPSLGCATSFKTRKHEKAGMNSLCAVILKKFKIWGGKMVEVKPREGGARIIID